MKLPSWLSAPFVKSLDLVRSHLSLGTEPANTRIVWVVETRESFRSDPPFAFLNRGPVDTV